MKIAKSDLEKITAPIICLRNFDDDVIRESHAVTREMANDFYAESMRVL